MSASVESQPQLPPSGIPVPSGIKRAQSRSPDLAGDRRHTTEGDHSVGHKKKMFGHRRTHSHETNVVHGSKTKSEQYCMCVCMYVCNCIVCTMYTRLYGYCIYVLQQ